MHLNKIGEVNVVLQECIEIFKEQMEKEAKAGRDIILDEYRPAEGDYIIVKKDGSLMSCSIKEDKKKKTLEGINESDFLYRDICFYDYHSRLISMDKPQDSKKIVHSNNYMSFWVKYESFDNGKLDVQAIDRYFDVLINPREKYKNADRVMYDFIYQQIGDVDTQQLESNRKWIKENIFQLDKTELNLQKKKYLKIFFEDDRDTYIREEKRYVMTKIYNKNDYNIEINNNMYGLPNDNLGLNSKKPYLEHKTRKLPVPNLIDVKQVLLQRKFFDFLANKANAGLTNVFFENESREITAYPNGEFEKGDFSGYFLQIQKGKSVLIKYQDTIVDYRYNLQKNFVLKKILNWTPNKNSTQSNNVYENYYDTYTDKNKIFTVLDDVLFFKCLKRNLFNDVEDIMVDNPCIKRNIIMSRDIIFAWIYKGQKNGAQNVKKSNPVSSIHSSLRVFCIRFPGTHPVVKSPHGAVQPGGQQQIRHPFLPAKQRAGQQKGNMPAKRLPGQAVFICEFLSGVLVRQVQRQQIVGEGTHPQIPRRVRNFRIIVPYKRVDFLSMFGKMEGFLRNRG